MDLFNLGVSGPTPTVQKAPDSVLPNKGGVPFSQLFPTEDHYKARILFLFIFTLISISVLNWLASYRDGIPTVNRCFALEPRIFSRIRWGLNAKGILESAHMKFHNRPYRLARGDVDVLILPPYLVPELNSSAGKALNSLEYQCNSIRASCNELEIVLQSDFHLKMLLQRGTPALPSLTTSFGERVQDGLERQFSMCQSSWKVVQPLPRISQCVSQLIGLMLLGTPICDDQKLIELFPRITELAFFITFIMRFVPQVLQNVVLWLIPAKWELRRSLREVDKIMIPELEQRRLQEKGRCLPNVASWMILEGNKAQDLGPELITRLIGTAFAGGVWSTSTLVFGVITDLVGQPKILDEIREEIRRKHTEIEGHWDFAAFNSLGRLDSAMKETSRMAPGSLLVYGRVVEKEFRLSSGLLLKQGQHIATAPHTYASDTDQTPNMSAYDPLRWYKLDPEGHLARPFSSLNELGRFGSGRRACPGRFLASMIAKVMLTKMLDEYEFAFVDEKRPAVLNLHEFVYMHPNSSIKMRKRQEISGIVFE